MIETRLRRTSASGAIAVALIAPPPAWAAGAASAWSATRSPGGLAMAIAAGPPSVGSLVLTCQGRTPFLAFRPARPARTRWTSLEFVAGTTRVQTPMPLEAASGLWGAQLHDRRVLDLLAGDASAVDLTFDGRGGGSLALAGARTALRQALSACYAVPGGAATVASPGVEPSLRGADAARLASEPLADLILSAAPSRPGAFMKIGALIAATPGLKLAGGASDAREAELNGAGVVFSGAMDGVSSIEINNLPLPGRPRTPQGGTRMNPRPYDVEAALKARGVKLSPILCTVHQGQRTDYFRATAPGKAPFWMRSVNWKPASPNQNYVLAASVVFETPPSAQSLVEGMEEPPTLCR